MQTLVARYHVTTPLFMGAPAGPDTLELNLRGVKSAVRFWWRALNYANLTGDGKNLKELQAAEARLFGIAADDNPTNPGGSRLKWRVRWDDPAPTEHKHGAVLPGAGSGRGLVYLAGQGLMEVGRNVRAKSTGRIIRRIPWGEQVRPCYWNPGVAAFEIILLAAGNSLHDEAAWTGCGRSLVDSLYLFGLLGGLGSRKSRGFGSVGLDRLAVDGLQVSEKRGPRTVDEYADAVASLLHTYKVATTRSLAEFSAFSQRSRIWVIAQRGSIDSGQEVANDPLSLLDYVGKQMVRYRSYGRNGGTTLNESAEKNFQDDHDWAMSPNTPRHNVRHARRIAFGMPQGYAPSCAVSRVKPEGQERRTSPLQLHIHRLGDGNCIALATMLPARLVPTGKRLDIELGIGPGRTLIQRPLMTDFEQKDAWDVLTEFVQGTIGPRDHKTHKPYFNMQRQIWPVSR